MGFSLRRMVPWLLITAAGPSFAQGEEAAFAPRWKPTLEVHRAHGAIRVDGVLDDPGWQGAAHADGFAEVDPGDQVKPAIESEAWLAYDDHNFYIALLAYDNDPSKVRATLCERDNIFRDDYFGIMFDTYGDLGWGYEIFVNPLGIQGDLRVTPDGNEDISFDVVFDSRGQVTERGYQVELAIPFASLRFPDRADPAWRVNFWRDQQRDQRRRYAWAAVDRANACWMCSWGTVKGFQGIRPASSIDLIPTAVAFQSGSRDLEAPGSEFDDENPDGDLSLNARYGITSGSSAELSLNPDFSQIESDAEQIDVNSPFALFFSERRPFFQEGSNLYDTWISAIYTRTINDPDVAAKFTGQFGNTRVLYLGAQDVHSAVIVPSEERSFFFEADRAFSNILRAQQAYGEASYVGALFTDRRLTGDVDGSGTVFGVDGRHRLSDAWQVEYQLLGSHTEEPTDTTLTSGSNDALFDDHHTVGFDGETFDGDAAYFSVEGSGRVWGHDIDYWEYSPAFRTDNGFTTRTGYRMVNLSESAFFRPNRKFLVTTGVSLDVGREWNYVTDQIEDGWIRPNVNVTLPYQTSFGMTGLWSGERFHGTVYNDIRSIQLDAETRPSQQFLLGGYFRFGKLIARNVDDPFLGDAVLTEVWSTLRPTSRLLIEPGWAYQEMGRPEVGGKAFAGYVLRTRLNYQFTRELVVRFVTQYNSFDDRVEVDPLLTYRVNPFTVVFLGATTDYGRFVADGPPEPGDPSNDSWELTDRQLFAKIQYLFRL